MHMVLSTLSSVQIHIWGSNSLSHTLAAMHVCQVFSFPTMGSMDMGIALCDLCMGTLLLDDERVLKGDSCQFVTCKRFMLLSHMRVFIGADGGMALGGACAAGHDVLFQGACLCGTEGEDKQGIAHFKVMKFCIREAVSCPRIDVQKLTCH